MDNANWVENWLRRPEVPGRIIAPRLQKLSGSEEDALRHAQFRDQDDFPFLVLARSSDSKRLVTREEDFNRQAQRGIHRILGVVCKGYEEARDECAQV